MRKLHIVLCNKRTLETSLRTPLLVMPYSSLGNPGDPQEDNPMNVKERETFDLLFRVLKESPDYPRPRSVTHRDPEASEQAR